MKSNFLKWLIQTGSLIALGLFCSGVAWSLFPLGGDTLPHWIANESGMSFGWSALLVSSALGMLGVGSIGLYATYLMIEPEGMAVEG